VGIVVVVIANSSARRAVGSRGISRQLGGTPHGAHRAAAAAAAVEEIGAVRFEAAHAGARGHLQAFEHRAVGRVDVAQLALVAFPGAVPELAVDPGHAGDEAVGLDRADDGPRLGVDLVDAAAAVLAHPQAALGPGEAGVAAAARRGDGPEHAARRGVDLVDALLGDLPQVLAVERGAGVGALVEPARRRAVGGIEGHQRGAGGGPDPLAVPGHAGDHRRLGEGAEFAHDLGRAHRRRGLRGTHRQVLRGASTWRDGADSTQAAAWRGVTRSS
jgi:hypothetical protein